MWATYIRLPSPQEAVQNMHSWRLQTGIPGIVGAIDGTHIHIQRPCNHGEAYFNRKSFYSLNVQGTSFPIAVRLLLILAMVDYKKKIIDLEAGWPGSVGDGRIWNSSMLKKTIDAWISKLPTAFLPTGVHANGDEVNEDIPPFILGDSAYPNTRHMVTTYKTTEILSSPVVRELNKKLGGARYHVENAFGILKARFQIFKRPLECAQEDVRLAIALTSSIFILHNFLIEVHDVVNDSLDPEVENRHVRNEDDYYNQEDEDTSSRDILLRHIRYIMDADN